MKKTCIRKLVAGIGIFAALSFSFISCANLIESNRVAESSTEYGSITINGGKTADSESRRIDVSTITSATVIVSGYGMQDMVKNNVTISSGQGSVTIDNIPVGRRVVTVQSNVTGVVIRGYADVVASATPTSCTVNWETTKIATVYYELIESCSEVAGIDSASFSSKIPDVGSSLFNAEKFAKDFKTANFISTGMNPVDYILDFGTVSVTTTNAAGYKVQITDSATDVKTISGADDTFTLKAAPGTWKAWVLDSTGTKVAEKDITVVAGETSTVDVKYNAGSNVTGKIVVHVPSSLGYKYIWAWATSGNTNYTGGTWPGKEMTLNGSNYDYTINQTACKIIFNNNAGSTVGTNQTNDLWITEGEWNYIGGKAGTKDTTGSSVASNFEEVPSEPGITLTVNSATPHGDAVKIYVSSTSGAPTLWAWTSTYNNITTAVSYPGVTMTAATDLNDNTGWYVAEMDTDKIDTNNTETISFILNSGSNIVSTKTTTFWYDAAGLVGSANAYYDSDQTTVPEPVAPTLEITPASGKEIGTSSSIKITANFGYDTATVKTATINGTEHTLSEGVNTFLVSDYETEAGKTITVSATLTNSKGSVTKEATYTTKVTKEDPFTWDNVNCYFVLTDRFYNGDTGNDHSYYRQNASNNATLASGYNNVATFHGGDIKGLTAKMDYFKKLGVNAIWITAPYEQAHGWCTGGGNGFPHYAFHGYYTQDWTYMDQNMGTIEEFRTFVQTCHANGIRVVMDVVMNHTGYNTVEDMISYNFGNYSLITKGHGWCENTGSWSANPDASDSNGYWSGTNWDLWWGKWIRSFNYSTCLTGNGDWDKCGNSGLPDVRSEMEEIVDIPTFLQTKWTNEPDATTVPAATGNTLEHTYGDYKLPSVSDVDWWNKTGDWRGNKCGCPVEYQIVWLSGWVREFGIDGFRCDTAKHVQPKYWGMLKDACEDALDKWRNDSNKIDESGAKDWDEGFWTTGECFTYYNANGGRSDPTYFGTNDQGKFDSMINFSMNENHSTPTNSKYPSTENWATYAATYAANVDSDGNGNKDNSLMYLSSHDTSLCRPSDQYDVGTNFVLLPGGIQIYYGDESLRGSAFTDCGDNDMTTRGDMNWSDGSISGSASNGTANDSLVAHWGKLGNFRKYNPAVGAGVQTVSGSTYVRTYSGAAGENKVAISLTSKTVTGLPYSDGTTVYNWYDGKSAIVSNGSAAFSESSASTSAPVLCSDRNPATYGVTF
ncbi:alpha-amylase family glycosyl hydrolase [uncultured Treponema sp.]|uniref:alpha-amylase family glycosyl hydrolase n=1 Tax=uncultured Treponema sp. TaxID=162155 RepID=UPI0025E13231|nr:alpha-amylase family glycosyl hydrolase [uncultured Treponema sp.]